MIAYYLNIQQKTHLKYSETCFINCVGLFSDFKNNYTLGLIADMVLFKSDMVFFKSDMV